MTSGWVDFHLVKESVSMQMVLEHYGVNGLRKNGSELRGRCPIHKGGDGSRTFQVNVSKNVFQCFSCKARGNVLDFVAALEGCSVREAALKLQVWFGVGESQQRPMPPQEAPAQTIEAHTQAAALAGPINPPPGFQLRVDSGHEYGIGRGVSKFKNASGSAGIVIFYSCSMVMRRGEELRIPVFNGSVAGCGSRRFRCPTMFSRIISTKMRLSSFSARPCRPASF
jgi:CHC2 zinc finger